MRSRFTLPLAARNPVSLIGVAIATAMAWVFLALLALDLLGYFANPYIGLLLFVAVPAAFVFGLLLIAFGMWRGSRRLRQAPDAVTEWPVLDLRVPRQRTTLALVVALTFVNVLTRVVPRLFIDRRDDEIEAHVNQRIGVQQSKQPLGGDHAEVSHQ